MGTSAPASGRGAAKRLAWKRSTAPRDRWGVAGFVARLLAGWAIAVVLLAWVPPIEHWSVVGTVASARAALRLMTFHPIIAGTTITLGRAALRIIPECTPLMPGLL